MSRVHSGFPGTEDPLWFKDAIFYELHVKAFFDSNDDGIGDFRGLIDKLDYFQELGVTALWLLPTFPSPLRDDGYDISDYTSVQPAYGSLHDFEAFVDAAHSRGLRVVTELVLNHTSDQHPWFQAARRDPTASTATTTSGATPTSATRTRASSSRIPSRPTGPGIRSPASTTGIASSATSRT